MSLSYEALSFALMRLSAFLQLSMVPRIVMVRSMLKAVRSFSLQGERGTELGKLGVKNGERGRGIVISRSESEREESSSKLLVIQRERESLRKPERRLGRGGVRVCAIFQFFVVLNHQRILNRDFLV